MEGSAFNLLAPVTRGLLPGCDILMKTFLQFESRGDDDDRTIRIKVL